jgi:hypothetical protein
MNVYWVAPIATALVGIAGIVGTIYGVRLQRETQLESVRQQKYLEAEANVKMQKQLAFVEFWNAHQELLHTLQSNSSATGSDRAQQQVVEAYSRLFAARNTVALLASRYTIYYMDQIMGDMQKRTETPRRETFVKQFPNADHYVYYLMRAELSGKDLNRQSAQEIRSALKSNSLGQALMHNALWKP